MTIRFTLTLPAASLAASLAAAAPLTIADQGSFAAGGTVIETTARHGSTRYSPKPVGLTRKATLTSPVSTRLYIHKSHERENS